MIRRILTIVRKELLVIRRSRLYIALALVVPVALMLLFGFGFTFDVNQVPVGVLDLSRTSRSREYLDAFFSSRYFRLERYAEDLSELEQALTEGKIRLALVIPPEFSRLLDEGRTAEVQALIDGSWPNQGTIIRGYLSAVNARFNEGRAKALPYVGAGFNPALLKMWRGPLRNDPLTLETRIWFNPTLESKNFVVPGMIVTTLMFYPALLTTLAVVREKELGSILNINTSPISPFEFLLGKLLPYFFISLVNFAIIFAMTLVIFRVPFRGSFSLLLLGSILYILSTVGIGLLVSLVTRTQVAATLLTFFATIIPSFLYSGFLIPISSMDAVSQGVSFLLPARYMTEIVHGTFLKGAGFTLLWPRFLALLLYSLVLSVLALKLFRKRA
ncbi:MAG: ABC transporter permease [candidate division NC10 bacterium]|nr:ABC transporter permease [candidate division NC10 bacterium]